MNEWEAVAGLEVHVELRTQSKIFCGCKNEFGAAPNTQVCPVCLGMPGSLPALNERAVEYGAKAGMALGCDVMTYSRFDRKHYFYPDLAKAYQITQAQFPLCRDGVVRLEAGEIGVERIHLEEDAGKLTHTEDATLVDYNRGGVPLIEIVTRPDFRSGEQIAQFLRHVQQTMQFLGVSDCKMQEGSLRCDLNLSVRRRGSEGMSERTEIKNIGSISLAALAFEQECKRQIEIYERGGSVQRETRRLDEATGESVLLRKKEQFWDYLFFPEPDLPPVWLNEEKMVQWRNELPETALQKRERYQAQYGLSNYDAQALTATRETAQYFEACVALHADAKTVCNYIIGDLAALRKESDMQPEQNPVPPQMLVELITLVQEQKISIAASKTALRALFMHGGVVQDTVDRLRLWQQSDAKELRDIVCAVLNEQKQAAADVRAGKQNAVKYLMGQVMKQTGGRANPQVVMELIEMELTNETGKTE